MLFNFTALTVLKSSGLKLLENIFQLGINLPVDVRNARNGETPFTIVLLCFIGGALFMDSSTAIISQSRFERNRVRWGVAQGGALRILSSNLFCNDSEFSSNRYFKCV